MGAGQTMTDAQRDGSWLAEDIRRRRALAQKIREKSLAD